jgi:hypothetical protein
LLRTIVRWGARPRSTGGRSSRATRCSASCCRRKRTRATRHHRGAVPGHARPRRRGRRARPVPVPARARAAHGRASTRSVSSARPTCSAPARSSRRRSPGRGSPWGTRRTGRTAGVHFRAEHDKRGYAAVVPINAEARAALDAYLRDHPRVGEAPLFPRRATTRRRCTRSWPGTGSSAPRRSPGCRRSSAGGWHAYRRQWATERRHLPPQDLMAAAAGGACRPSRAYQHADDAATTYGGGRSRLALLNRRRATAAEKRAERVQDDGRPRS